MLSSDWIRHLVETAPLPMQQWREEIIPFLTWWDARTPLLDRRVLEIGTGAGGLTTVWAQLASRTISVDLEPTSATAPVVGERDELIQVIAESLGHIYTPVFGRSQDATTRNAVLSRIEGMEIDLLFLDGDHSYEGLVRDWELYRPLVRKGGVVAFHDLNSKDWPSVQQVWQVVSLPQDVKVFTVNASWGGIGAVIV